MSCIGLGTGMDDKRGAGEGKKELAVT